VGYLGVPRRLSSKTVPTDTDGTVIPFPTPVRMKNPAAVALGKLGGAKGGQKRAEKLTSEERIAIARQGGLARQAMARSKRRGGG